MESYSICEWLRDKINRPLHLYDTWGLRIVNGFESGLVGLEGGGWGVDLNNVIYNVLKIVACLIMRLRSRVGHPRAVIRSAGFVFCL